MDQKFQRIFLVRIESRRLHHESLNVFVVCAFERERFQRLHVDLRQQRVVHVGDWRTVFACPSGAEIRSPNFVWRGDRHVCEIQSADFAERFAKDQIVGM